MKTKKDLLTAEHELSFSDAVTESICFHCQQAVEKSLSVLGRSWYSIY